jgi:PIN domain nuclease of toxin-antitoxin system
MSCVVLDAGALIALDRNDRAMWARLVRVLEREQHLVTHAGIVGQVWRHPARQARLARSLKFVDVRPLDIELAKESGLLMATTKLIDVHDAALALLCQANDTLLTSDVQDLAALVSARGLTSVSIVHV